MCEHDVRPTFTYSFIIILVYVDTRKCNDIMYVVHRCDSLHASIRFIISCHLTLKRSFQQPEHYFAKFNLFLTCFSQLTFRYGLLIIC